MTFGSIRLQQETIFMPVEIKCWLKRKMIFIYFTGIGILLLLCFTYFGETSLDYESSHVRVFNNINRAGRKVAAIF